MIFCGIDPGVTGAVGQLSSEFEDFVDVQMVPLLPQKSGKKEYDIRGMADMIDFGDGENNQVFVVLEKQHAFPKQGVVSTGSIMRGYGIWEGILSALNLDYITVPPQTWQKELIPGKTGETKQRSIAMAGKLFPEVSLFAGKGRTPHHGLSDALLIAEYARRVYKFHKATGQTEG